MFERPICAGNATAAVKSADPINVIAVRLTGFDPVAEGGSAAVEKIAAAADIDLSQFVSRELTKLNHPELTSVSIIVSGGRGCGLGRGENFTKVLKPPADRLNATLDSSPTAVDAGFAPNDH